MEEQFGIAKEAQAKTMLVQGSTRAAALVADGKAELILTLVSEILPAHGVQLVGPFPKEVQHYVAFAGGVGANAKNAEAGKMLIKFLTSPAAAPTFKAKGLELPH
jgi:molybdate transport system substrate-binding protein